MADSTGTYIDTACPECRKWQVYLTENRDSLICLACGHVPNIGDVLLQQTHNSEVYRQWARREHHRAAASDRKVQKVMEDPSHLWANQRNQMRAERDRLMRNLGRAHLRIESYEDLISILLEMDGAPSQLAPWKVSDIDPKYHGPLKSLGFIRD